MVNFMTIFFGSSIFSLPFLNVRSLSLHVNIVSYKYQGRQFSFFQGGGKIFTDFLGGGAKYKKYKTL